MEFMSYNCWHHVIKVINHESVLLKMTIIVLNSMPIFGEVTAYFQSCQPLMPKLEISIEFQMSVLRTDMNIVTSGPGDMTAKENLILISTTQTINKNNITNPLVVLNTSFGNKDPLVINIFKKY